MDEKNMFKYGFIVACILFSLLFLNTCSSNRTNKKLIRQQTVLIEKLVSQDSIQNYLLTRAQYEIQIQRLELAKRIVYDNNTIVRTTTRPDDVMNMYDEEIQELKEKMREDLAGRQ